MFVCPACFPIPFIPDFCIGMSIATGGIYHEASEAINKKSGIFKNFDPLPPSCESWPDPPYVRFFKSEVQ